MGGSASLFLLCRFKASSLTEVCALVHTHLKGKGKHKMNNLINLVKTMIQRNKGKTLSIFIILILGLSSAFAIMPAKANIVRSKPKPGSDLNVSNNPGSKYNVCRRLGNR